MSPWSSLMLVATILLFVLILVWVLELTFLFYTVVVMTIKEKRANKQNLQFNMESDFDRVTEWRNGVTNTSPY